MPSTHTFVDDVFISYRHLDNKDLDEHGKGWIDNFHERFENVLLGKLGYEPRIWRDTRLPGNAYFADVLEERIRNTAVVISVLSPGYLMSDWCMGELREFCRLAEQTGGLRAGNNMRIFKAVKFPTEPEEHPPEFRKQLGYEFYEIDKMTRRPTEFAQAGGRDRAQRYWSKLDELAWDVRQVLYAINPRARAAAGSVFTPPKGTIYLAETTRDLAAQRDKIKRELQDHGYGILPDKELPAFSPSYEEAVSECVGRAKLSVHLIGENYGLIPEGAGGRSIVRLQNEVAARRCCDDAFSRLLWLPVGLTPHEPEQEQFIEHLKKDSEMQRGAELLQTPLEELKSHIQKRLSSNGNGKKPEPVPGQSPPKIYLIFDKRDIRGVIPLSKYLTAEKKCEVLLPPLDDEGGGEAQPFDIHNENLKECDAVLIYYGQANQGWFEFKRRDLKKLVGLDRKSPLAAAAFYVASPETMHKEMFDNPDALVIKNFADFSPAALEPFLARVAVAAKGAVHAGN